VNDPRTGSVHVVREPLDFTAEEIAEEQAFYGLFGPWAPFDLDGVRAFFDGFDRPWWLVGGWAIEAFTGALREHEDIDVSMLACDAPALREFVADRWHLWTNLGGTLRPLTDRWPDLPHPECQLWVRRDATSPWVLDMPLSPDVDGLWKSKRMPEHVAPLDEVTWVTGDGVRVANAEIVLLHKAAPDRRKDRRDLARALPLLSDDARAWLRESIAALYPGHPWLELMGTGDGSSTSDPA
jgi:hypothetical protein